MDVCPCESVPYTVRGDAKAKQRDTRSKLQTAASSSKETAMRPKRVSLQEQLLREAPLSAPLSGEGGSTTDSSLLEIGVGGAQ